MDTKGLEISVLIKIRSFAPVRRHGGGGGTVEDRSIFDMERGEHALRCIARTNNAAEAR